MDLAVPTTLGHWSCSSLTLAVEKCHIRDRNRVNNLERFSLYSVIISKSSKPHEDVKFKAARTSEKKKKHLQTKESIRANWAFPPGSWLQNKINHPWKCWYPCESMPCTLVGWKFFAKISGNKAFYELRNMSETICNNMTTTNLWSNISICIIAQALCVL